MSDDMTLPAIVAVLACVGVCVVYMFAGEARDGQILGQGYGFVVICFFVVLGATEVAIGFVLWEVFGDDSDLRYLLFWTFVGGLLAALAFGLWARRLRRLDLVLGMLASFAIALSAIVWWYQLL